MKFVKLPIVDKDGESSDMLINPDHVSMLIKVPIPTGLMSSDGKTPMIKTGTGICLLNGNALPCKMSEEEVQDILESGSIKFTLEEKKHLL